MSARSIFSVISLTEPLDLSSYKYKCASCDEVHTGFPVCAFGEPSGCFQVPEEFRDSHVELTEDLCKINPWPNSGMEHAAFFVRAVLKFPIKGQLDVIEYGVWVSQSEDSFEGYKARFNEDNAGIATFGWLGLDFPGFCVKDVNGKFEFAPVMVHFQGKTERPFIEISENEFEIHLEQKHGLTMERAQEIISEISSYFKLTPL